MTDETRRYMEKYTKKERALNWLSYMKWWLVLGAAGLALAVFFVVQICTRVEPDYEIAYVGQYAVPEEMARSIEAAVAALGTDRNGDGRVEVRVNSYTVAAQEDPQESRAPFTNGEKENTEYIAAVQLQADLMAGTSCFFLLEDPAWFQAQFHLLTLDGSFPEETDDSVAGRVYRWGDCPVLQDLPLDPADQEALAPLYLGRRAFSASNGFERPEAAEALWDALTAGGQPW